MYIHTMHFVKIYEYTFKGIMIFSSLQFANIKIKNNAHASLTITYTLYFTTILINCAQS